MNEISNGQMVKGCFKVSILIKTDILPNVSLPIMPDWLSRTIPMSKYFLGPDHFDKTKFSCMCLPMQMSITFLHGGYDS